MLCPIFHHIAPALQILFELFRRFTHEKLLQNIYSYKWIVHDIESGTAAVLFANCVSCYNYENVGKLGIRCQLIVRYMLKLCKWTLYNYFVSSLLTRNKKYNMLSRRCASLLEALEKKAHAAHE